VLSPRTTSINSSSDRSSIPNQFIPQIAFARHHAQSERRLRLVEEHGLAKDLVRLVGDHFVNMLRAAHQAYGDALGINKPALPSAARSTSSVHPRVVASSRSRR